MSEKAMTIRLDERLAERLRTEAFEQRVTQSAIVRDALSQRFSGWDRDDSGPWPVSRRASSNAESDEVTS